MNRNQRTLESSHLTRTFGKGKTLITAVNDVSLGLSQGEAALLMGPSGSGKSTLLAILSGILPPDQGRVLALGADLWSLSERERRHFRQAQYGFIFQGFNLLPALNARQQLEIVLRWGENASVSEARRRSEEMLDLLGLRQKMHLLPEELSGGEKQRVAIGRALIKKPAFCFADEPTSALGWEHGRQVIELLCEAAHQRGATVLIVAHDSRIVPWMDRVWQLRDGRLSEGEASAEPAPEEVLTGRS
ncbi:MAG: ABC transporter ATP-binding protein [Gemmataceae bacterium]